MNLISLLIAVGVKGPNLRPNFLQDVIYGLKRSVWLIREAVDWQIKRDFSVAKIRGKSQSENEPVVVYVGRESILPDLAQAFFSSHCIIERQEITPTINAAKLDIKNDLHHGIRRSMVRRSVESKADADILILETPPWRLSPTKNFVFYQTLADASIDLSQGYEQWLAGRSQGLRKHIQRSINFGDTVIWTQDESKVRFFYDELLKPMIEKRHGAFGHVPKIELLLSKSTSDNLLMLLDPQSVLVGGLFVIKSPWTGWRCLLIANAPSIDRSRASEINARLRAEVIKAAIQAGEKRISLGLSPAAHNHGIFENKRRFGATPNTRPLNYPMCQIKAMSPVGQKFLDEIQPYIFRDDYTATWVKREANHYSEATNMDAAGAAIAKSAAHMGIATALTMALGLILRLAMPRVYGPANMGTFYYTESLATIFLSILPLGLATYIMREVPSNHQAARPILSQLIPAQATLGILLLTAMISFLFFTGSDLVTIYCALAVGIFCACYNFHRSIIGRIYLALNKSGFVAKTEVVARVLLVALASTAMAAGASIVATAACFAIAQAAVVAAMLWRARTDGLTSDKFSWQQLKPMIVSSLPFFAVATLIEIYGSIDTTMLRWLTNAEEVAYYGAANKLKGAGLALLPILQASLQPELSRSWASDKELFARLVNGSMRILAAVSFSIAAVMIFLPDILSRIIFGIEFDPAIRSIAWLAPVLVLTYLNVLMGSCLGIIGTGIPFLVVTAVSLVLNIALNLLVLMFLAPKLGNGGGAASVAFATVISELFVILMMKRIFKQGLSYGTLLFRLTFTLGPCLIVASAVETILAWQWWWRCAGVILLLPLYLISTKLIKGDDWRWLRQKIFHKDRRVAQV